MAGAPSVSLSNLMPVDVVRDVHSRSTPSSPRRKIPRPVIDLNLLETCSMLRRTTLAALIAIFSATSPTVVLAQRGGASNAADSIKYKYPSTPKLDALKRHCDAVGRDFSTLRKTLNVRVAIAKTQAEAKAMVEKRMRPGSHPVVGDPAAVRDQLTELADLGFDFSVLTFMNFQELDDLKLFVDEVMPAFA